MNSLFDIWHRMSINVMVASICAVLYLPTTYAAPVEIDTPDVHIVVMRALDSWSGDEGASEDSLEAVADHEGGFQLERPQGLVLGFPLLFGGLNDDVVVQGVNSALKAMKFKLTQSKVNFKVDKPIALEPEKFAEFAKYQRDLFQNLVISEGNPTTLHNSVSARKFFSSVLALGTVAIAGDKYGTLGKEAMLNSGIPGDVYQFSSSGRAALTPMDTPDFKSASYKSIDVRRVIQGNNERVGQVIIAYKTDKTEAAENDALIKAIVSLTGADTTVEAVKQAREEDLSKRQAIWNACVSEGKCKND